MEFTLQWLLAAKRSLMQQSLQKVSRFQKGLMRPVLSIDERIVTVFKSLPEVRVEIVQRVEFGSADEDSPRSYLTNGTPHPSGVQSAIVVPMSK
jgi:hypothetical protein